MTVENLTVMESMNHGILVSTLPFNPIFTTWEVLDESQRGTLMFYDHMYLGVTIDRGQLPTSSTADAEEWLEDLGTRVQTGITDEGLNCTTQTSSLVQSRSSISSGLIKFLITSS